MLHSDKGHVKWEQRDATQTLSCVWAEVGLGGGVVVRWVRKNACEQRQTESAGIGSFKGQLGGNELRISSHLLDMDCEQQHDIIISAGLLQGHFQCAMSFNHCL